MKFSAFRLSTGERLQLIDAQTECTVTWLDPTGWPVTAVQSYVWRDDAFWVTTFRDRPRVSLLAREPRASVTVSSAGTPLAPEQMASARTLATVHHDGATAEWFYPAFCRRVTSDETAALAMAKILAAQDRVIIELRPQTWNTFSGTRMRAGEARR